MDGEHACPLLQGKIFCVSTKTICYTKIFEKIVQKKKSGGSGGGGSVSSWLAKYAEMKDAQRHVSQWSVGRYYEEK